MLGEGRHGPLSAAGLGFGIGLRREHFTHLLGPGGEAGALRAAGVDWLEAISENFFERGGRPLAALERVRREVPVVLHGVGLGIGDAAPLSDDYLEALRDLARRVEPAWVSDHLCWGSIGGHRSHDLLPLPLTEEALDHVALRTLEVQARLGRRIVLENVSSYVEFTASAIPEWVFLGELARRSGCGLLLDLNNVVVNARNHGFSAEAYVDAIDPAHVAQLHLAGHSRQRLGHLELAIDTHVGPVPPEVWALYERFVARAGEVPTLIEWDTDVPPFEAVAAEAREARRRARAVLEGRRGAGAGAGAEGSGDSDVAPSGSPSDARCSP